MSKEFFGKLAVIGGSYLIPALTVVFAVVSLFQVYDQFDGYRELIRDKSIGASSLEADFIALRAKLEAVEDVVSALPSKTREMIEGSTEVRSNIDYVLLDKRIGELSKRLGALEAAISESPEKALSIPMLRKDQKSLSKEMDASRSAVKGEIDRLNDQFKWILNGIATALVLMLGGALAMLGNVYFKSAQKE